MADHTPSPLENGTGSLYLLDAHGLIFQMFHGIAGSMSAPDGRPTNAVFGVTRSLMELYDQGADYLIAAFDTPEPTFRNQLSPEYKAHRPPPPPDLLIQVPMILQVLEAMRIPILKMPGFEADDLLATLAEAGAARGLAVHLCTSDKDCRQLLSDRVRIRNLRKGESFDAESLMREWGVRPSQVVDFQALVGDSVDNVKGVPGCGPKTAAKWLQTYHTLEGVIANAQNVGGPKLRQALLQAIADGTLAQSRQLVRLDTQVPITCDWDAWKRQDWDGQRLLELFQEFDFRSFANRVRGTLAKSGRQKNDTLLTLIGSTSTTPAVAPHTAVSIPTPRSNSAKQSSERNLFSDAETDADSSDTEDFAFGANVPANAWVTDYQLIDDEPKFSIFLAQLRCQKRFSFDLETTHLDPLRGDIVGYAFCWQATEAYYLPVRGPAGEKRLDPETTLAALKPLLEDPAIAKVNQNIKYDLLALRNVGVRLAGVAGDPMVADYLLHAGERSHNLDDMTRRYFQHENTPITALIGKGKQQVTIDQVPIENVKDYAAEDADTAFRLAERLEPDLATAELRPLYDALEIPLIEVLAELEFNGVRLDVPFLQALSVEMGQQLSTLEATAHALAGKPFNLASPKQLREILFDEMRLPVQKRTGTTNEPSTDQESLERLAALGHALPRELIAHRQVAKLKGTYVDALPALVNPRTGRLHTSFNQTVAATGRLSSSEPNLQNIPARTEQGKQIRQAFLPRENWVLISADYSQVELRFLAHFSADDNLILAFQEDRDIHASVAAEIFKIPEAEVTSEQRRQAKTVNFGVIYGMSAHGLATRLGMPKREAGEFIDLYFQRFHKVLAYQDTLLARARTSGYVSTILGRRRRFDPKGIRPNSTYHARATAEREAINMEIQGSAADLMKQAMLNVYRRLNLEQSPAKILLTVHDELVLECPPDAVASVAALVRDEMSQAMTLRVPLKVDVAVGPNWLQVQDVPAVG
ncbi:MAG: DNA polymerase I [Bacteroidales bacterium]|nr:DNA polymerase I [Bacteroidales bacterium]